MLMLPFVAAAQFEFGDTAVVKQPWEQFKLDTKKTIKLDFRNASVDLVLDLLSRTSGITIVKDPSLADRLTVTTPKAVKLVDAFEIVNAALGLRNYEIKKEGNMLVVRKKPTMGFGGRGGGMGMPRTPDMGMGGGPQSRTELKVYKVKYASSAKVAQVINEVFGGQTNNRFGRGGFGGFGGPMGMIDFMGGGAFTQETPARASSDDFSNSVIVNATSTVHKQVADLIKEIDQQTDQPMNTKVYPLQFASSDDAVTLVQNVLTANAPKGRGGSGSSSTVPIDMRFGGMMGGRFGGSQATMGNVVSDIRTNSLIVSATDETHAIVAKVLESIDTEVKVENSTFVVSLKNARADLVATLLSQTFGSRTGTGTNAGGNANRTNTNRTNTNNRRTNTGGGTGGTGTGGRTGATIQDEDSFGVALEDPNGNGGDLLTSVGVAQMFPTQRTNAGTRSTTGTGGTTGRNAAGQLVNVRNLQGQVTVIADTNTNSLIIVTEPGNVDLVKQILSQLDKIPEQVMIETMIIEATLDESTKFGVEWNMIQDKFLGNTGVSGSGGMDYNLKDPLNPPRGFKYTVTGGNLTGFLNLLKQDKNYNVLSTPRIFTSNNVQAVINISQSIPYVVSQREDANGNMTFNYSFQDVGIVLTVTPRISANGMVTLDVNQTANDLQGYTSFNAPIVNQRQAQTTVSVMDGETVILGGIIRNTVSSTVKKLPLLGDIPILGNLFRSTDKSKVKTELLVFLTPRIVRTPEDAQIEKASQEKQLSKQSQAQIEKDKGKNPPNKKTDEEVKK
jgi:general secretion pathway protein D